MNKQNNSPWLLQIDSSRPTEVLSGSENTDVCIVGAGISGVMTAYFTLRYTNYSVVMLEGHRVAHGSTGHNAGQIASYFERPFSSIVEEYGLEMAAQAQKDILSAWDLLLDLYQDLDISTPMIDFIGYAGISTIESVNSHLYNNFLRMEGGIEAPNLTMIDRNIDRGLIDKKFWNLCSFVDKSDLIDKLEVNDEQYIAVFSSKKGLVNSAALVMEVVLKLKQKYSDRFRVFEHSKVEKIVLHENSAEATSWGFKVHCKKIILATNGFEGVKITNYRGENLDHKLHENLKRVVGYMSGYLDNSDKDPTAISYFPATMQDSLLDQSTYFYLTRRKFSINGNDQNLVCIGGPETHLPLSNIYVRDYQYDSKAKEELDNFVYSIYKPKVSQGNASFNWFGLMGYTKSGLRLIGFDCDDKSLMYNLGCNGVGILSSIYGGYRISQLLSGKTFSKSVFDYR